MRAHGPLGKALGTRRRDPRPGLVPRRRGVGGFVPQRAVGPFHYSRFRVTLSRALRAVMWTRTESAFLSCGPMDDEGPGMRRPAFIVKAGWCPRAQCQRR